jgi:hypothetical protein
VVAGAGYDQRTAGEGGHTRQQQKESADINRSLLALKECLRSLAGVPGAKARPPFRESRLTRILEDTLRPAAQSALAWRAFQGLAFRRPIFGEFARVAPFLVQKIIIECKHANVAACRSAHPPRERQRDGRECVAGGRPRAYDDEHAAVRSNICRGWEEGQRSQEWWLCSTRAAGFIQALVEAEGSSFAV